MLTEIHKNIIRFTSASFLFAFFLGGHLLGYTLFLFLIAVVYYSVKNRMVKYRFNSSLVVLILFYAMHIVATIYSSNKQNASFDLQVKASLIVFPLIFLFFSDFFKKYRLYIIRFFVWSSAIISFILIVKAFLNYLSSKDISVMFYGSFSYFLHPSYYAMYLILAIVFALNCFVKKVYYKKYLLLIFVFVDVIALFLTDSKSGYLSFLIVVFYMIFSLLYKKSKKIALSTILLMALSVFVMFQTSKRMQIMLNVAENYKQTIENPNTYKESTGLRILSWSAATHLIKENVFVGVGSGDIKPKLLKKYEELNYKLNLKRQMNAHNQFLETWLGQGIVGEILLLLLFIIPFSKAVRNKNIVLQSFLLLLFINFLVESMLNVQAGTIFTGFFYSFLVTDDNTE